MNNNPKHPSILIRLLTLLLLLVSVFSGLFERWDLFGISLGVLIVIVILECYRLLSITICERFDRIENLFKSEDNKKKE